MFALLIALLFCCPLYAEDPITAELLRLADASYAKRSDLIQAQAALGAYQEAAKHDPDNVEVYWKASRVAWWLGDHAVQRADKLSWFQKGIDQAKAAIARNPDSVEAHFWLAANLGSYGESKGILKSLSLVKPIRQEMAEVIRINDRYLGGGAYRVLGAVDYKVPGIAGGSKKRALQELDKALAMDPGDPFNHYYRAEYFKIMGNKEQSGRELQTLRTMRVVPDSQPELEMLRQKADKNFGS